MWAAVNTKRCNFAVAVCNFDGKVKYGLPILVGDVVEVREECNGWYRGTAFRTKSTGIFPASYVVLRDYELHGDGSDAVPSLVEDAVPSEVCCVLREWNNIVKIQFLKNQRSLVKGISDVMSELVSLRKILLTEKFATGHMNETKSKITKKIDWGNKRLGLDLVPRLNNESVDADKMDPIELFRIHENSSLNAERDSKQRRIDTRSLLMTHHLVVRFKAIGCLFGEELEFQFALFDSQTNEFFTERFLLKVDRKGAIVNCDHSNLVTVFMDLGDKDFCRDTYLVTQMFRLGSLRDSSNPSKTPTLYYKRPYGCGVCSISQILKNKYEEEPQEIEVQMRINLCSESDFSQFHENLIKRPIPPSVGKVDVGFSLLLKMMHCNLEAPLAADLHLMKNAVLTNKIGFSDVIMPDTDRSDLYLTIERGEFERGSKTAQKNVEVRVLVLKRDGKLIEKCISRGTGVPDVSEYNSFIFYHMNNPRWNDTIRLRIPVDQLYSSHVRIEFRHCSNKDKTEKKLLGMCFVRLITDEFTMLADGSRELCFYKYDDPRKLQDPTEYLSLPDVATESQGGSSSSLHSPTFKRSDKEAVYISTKLCSTKFTQNATLLGILKWKLEPFRVNDHLNKLIFMDGEEIVKFLQWLMDALFDMMSPGNSANIKPMLVYKALIHVFHLLKDERYERFIPVMDSYISNNFSASLVYQELAKCSIEILEGVVAMGVPMNSQTNEQRKLLHALSEIFEDSASGTPSLQQQMLKSVQVLKSIMKCIVQSKVLYLNCPRLGDREDEVSEFLKDFFGSMMRTLSVETVIILKLQVVILHQIPGILLELSRLISPVSLCHTFCKLMSSIAKTSQMELIIGKLNCLRMMAQQPSLVSAYECKSVLIPFYVSELNYFLQMEKDPKPVAEILMEIMTTMHCDRKLNVPLTPNLSVILDGLLEEILNFLNSDIKSLPSNLIACLTSMLQLMDEQHFKQLLIRYEEKHLLEMFLEKLLVTLRNLFRRDFYPSDWLVMKMVTNRVVLQTSKLISSKLKEKFLGQNPFNRLPWSNYFYFAVTFVTQPCLQLERLSSVKRHRIRKRLHLLKTLDESIGYGDLRLKMVHEFLQNWKSLNRDQIHFIPEFIGPFLEMSLIPEPDVRNAVMPIFFEMMLREWENSNSFSKLENELIDQIDILMNNNKGDEEFKKLFHSVLLGKVQNHLGWSNKWKALIQSATNLLDVLLDYRNVLIHQDNMESQMKCIFNLLNYYSSVVQRQEKYIHYVYRLYELHVACGNHTEAAHTLTLHSNLLFWSDEMLPKFGSYPAQFGWQRLERIYETIIAEFDQGKMWEYGLPFLEKLADVYKEKIMYGKLSKQLRLQADFYQKILGDSKISDRFEPTYFLVRFFGLGFSSFLRDKEFIYRGNECEKLIPFQYRFQQEFSGASVLDHMNFPSDGIRQGPGRYLQVCVVTPLPVIDACFMMWNVPDPVRKFYRTNNVDEFYFDRPFHQQGVKDDNNDFKTLSCERYIMKTSEKFPNVMRWFEVTSRKKLTLLPIEMAIDAITKKNEELNVTLLQFSQNTSQNLNPLTMLLKGVIDAPVMGGFPKYQEAFLNKEFQKQNPLHSDKTFKLLELFNNQVSILEQAMHRHKQLAPPQQQPLHCFLEEKFDTLKQQIRESSHLVGYVPQKRRSQNTDYVMKPEQKVSPTPNGGLSYESSGKTEEERIGAIAKITDKKLKRDSTGKHAKCQWYEEPVTGREAPMTRVADEIPKTKKTEESKIKTNVLPLTKRNNDVQQKNGDGSFSPVLHVPDSNSISSSPAVSSEPPPPIPVRKPRTPTLSTAKPKMNQPNLNEAVGSVESKDELAPSAVSSPSGTNERPSAKPKKPQLPRVVHPPFPNLTPTKASVSVTNVETSDSAQSSPLSPAATTLDSDLVVVPAAPSLAREEASSSGSLRTQTAAPLKATAAPPKTTAATPLTTTAATAPQTTTIRSTTAAEQTASAARVSDEEPAPVSVKERMKMFNPR